MNYVNPATGPTDKKGWNAFHTDLSGAFPDLMFHIDRVVSHGNTVVSECTITGTQKKEFAGVPATNRAIKIPAAFVVDLEAGRVKRWHSYFDTATMMRQLGAMK